jgi:hypothetical protein
MRKLILSLAGLSLSVLLVLGQEPQPPAPTAALGQSQPATAPAPVISPYRIKAKDGAYFICAACYTGEHAPYLADQVVRQLRAKNINSFVYNYADKERFEQEKAYHEWKKNHADGEVYKARFTRVELQVAVLIGGFKTMDAAKAAVPTVRQLPPPVVTFPSGEDASGKLILFGDGRRRSALGNNPIRNVGSEEDEETHPVTATHYNPFESCFVVLNPAKEKKQDDDNYVDPHWKKLNASESYSLFRCKKPFTLVVKVYRNPQSYQSAMNPSRKEGSFLGSIGRAGPSNPGDVILATGFQAHELARFLREYKFEAYVLHTQFCSVVTVGGFAAQGDSEMTEMAQKIGKLRISGSKTPISSQSLDPNEDPFTLLPDPMPMRVPKL